MTTVLLLVCGMILSFIFISFDKLIKVKITKRKIKSVLTDLNVDKKSSSYRFAIHEVGHLVSGWKCSLVYSVDDASVYENGGHVLYKISKLENARYYWCRLVLALSGIAAEIIYLGKMSSGDVENDLSEAKEMSKKLCKLNFKPPNNYEDYIHVLPFQNMFSNKLNATELEMFRAAYFKAKDMVRSQKNFVDIAKALALKNKLTKLEMEAFLGPRIFTHVLGYFGATFDGEKIKEAA